MFSRMLTVVGIQNLETSGRQDSILYLNVVHFSVTVYIRHRGCLRQLFSCKGV
jgi:hypothetical protein